MRISEISRKSGVPAKTIRYYEEVGLIRKAARTESGYRIYDTVDLRTLQFVNRARSLGFPVGTVAELLALWRERSSAQVKQLAREHVRTIDRKIAELQSMRRTLGDLIERCHGDSRPDCPILDELAGTRDA